MRGCSKLKKKISFSQMQEVHLNHVHVESVKVLLYTEQD